MESESLTTRKALVCVIDDDEEMCGSLDSLLRSAGFDVRTFSSTKNNIVYDVINDAACLVLDVRLKEVSGLDFQQLLIESEVDVPIVLITGHGDIPMTVRGMKAGAVNFLSKPFAEEDLLAAVGEAVERDQSRRAQDRGEKRLRPRYDGLTLREREVMALVTAGLMNKQVAGRLGISEVTVKIHRGSLMRKMQAESLADLVRMAEALGVRETSVTRYRLAY
jgi:FixJ family two-component response regulator